MNADLACNLLAGEARSFAMLYSFVPHPPLYFLLSAAWMRVSDLGCTILALRLLSVALSLVALIALFEVGRRVGGDFLGLLAAFLYAMYPTAIFFSRLAFANDLLLVFLLSALWSWLVYLETHQRRFAYLASLAAGLSAVTQFTGATLMVAVLVLVARTDRRLLPAASFLAVLPPALFAAAMLSYQPDPFLFDLGYTLARAHLTPPVIGVFLVVAFAVYVVRGLFRPIVGIFVALAFDIRRDLPVYYAVATLAVFQGITAWNFLGWLDFYWLGVVGFFYIGDPHVRRAVLAVFSSYFAGLVVLNRMDHMVFPLYPLFCLGLAVFLPETFRQSCAYFSRLFSDASPSQTRHVSLVLVVYPLLILLVQDSATFLLERNLAREDIVSDAAVAAYVNARAQPDDVVIAYSKFGTMIGARVTTLVQSAAYSGRPFAYYADDMPASRFTANISCSNARFFVATPGLREQIGQEREFVWLDTCFSGWANRSFGPYLVLENPG